MTWELVRSGHLVRSLRLAPFATGAVAVAAFLAVRRGDPHDVVGDLRVLGLLLALGSGYVLDDGAAVTLQASPYSLARRLWLRIGCAAAVVVPLWSAVLAWFLPSAPGGDRWALGLGLTVELAAALFVIWALAAWGRRHGFEHPGIVTTPALLALLLVASSIPQAPMLVGPGVQWTQAHLRWSGILVGATGVLVAGMRDPAARWRSADHHRRRARQRG
ncbi:hypothetical protein ACFFX1_36660 [Dactylosporangium sucinum]|uniref:Uncharacterized protein n=1 Tax=Dactylosporangium sucinum TaxID=1424081 RepID=A0A917WXJ6_9ACTN|nr:hypothetical protein [Dactylosporangium sucinum]GGM37216.1 hypothetical protein GCM10007977_043280 [Dactylosporangium sucinum]